MGDRRPGGREAWLNAATVLLLVVAAGLLVRDRVLPAWRARQVVEVGETAPDDLALLALASGDTLRLGDLRPSLLLFFQSTCPACARNLPAWRRLVDRRPAGVRSLAVGLEPPAAALRYVREEIPDALGLRPREPGRTTRILGVEAVPSTLIVGPRGRLLWRRTGVLSDRDVRRALATARRASPARPPLDVPHTDYPNGRRP